MKWYFFLVPGLMAHLKRCSRNEALAIERERAYTKLAQDKHDKLYVEYQTACKEVTELRNELKAERTITSYYADMASWKYFENGNTYRCAYIDISDCDWSEQYQRYIGGKTAREQIKARKVVL